MKVRNLVLGLMLSVTVFNVHSAVMASGPNTAANAAATRARANATIASSVTTNMMNSQNAQNSVIVECALKTERVKKDGEWLGSVVPSLKETIKSERCQWKKKTMEEVNDVHYEFGKVKGIFNVKDATRVMIELVEVNE